MRAGGVRPAQDATAEVQALVEGHKGDVEAQVGKPLEVFKAVSFTTQVVAGTNYFVKVDCGEEGHVHLKIWKQLDNSTELSAVQAGKGPEDAIGFF